MPVTSVQRITGILDNRPQIATVTLRGVTTNPAIGNGTLSCTVSRTGNVARVVIDVIFGSTSTYGSGAWFWEISGLTVDTAALTQAGATKATMIGNCFINDDGNSFNGAEVVWDWSDNRIKVLQPSNFWQATHPITWGTLDKYTLVFEVPVL